jgi:serine/threonine-protein kinase
MAYEMLTGHPPFNGDNPMSVAYQHVHTDVPRCSGNAPGTPEALDDLIMAATGRDPAARPRDANAFLAALAGIRSQLGLRRVPVPVPQRRPAASAPVSQPAFAGPVFAGPGFGSPVGGPGPGPGDTRVLAGGPVTTVPPAIGQPPRNSPPRRSGPPPSRSAGYGADAG